MKQSRYYLSKNKLTNAESKIRHFFETFIEWKFDIFVVFLT